MIQERLHADSRGDRRYPLHPCFERIQKGRPSVQNKQNGPKDLARQQYNEYDGDKFGCNRFSEYHRAWTTCFIFAPEAGNLIFFMAVTPFFK